MSNDVRRASHSPGDGPAHPGSRSSVKRSMRVYASKLRSLSRLLLLFVASALAAQNATPAQPPTRPTSPPYTGDLSIFDSPGREQRLQIDRVMDILQIGAGKAVADIGAGSGWFTVRAARRVAAGGTVYAVDINPEAV